MDVYTRFKHLALQSNESPSTPEGLIQVSVKLKSDYVKVIDCFAEQLKISRTELINQLIKGSLPDALRAFYEDQEHNPLDHMSFDEFVTKVFDGEYLS